MALSILNMQKHVYQGVFSFILLCCIMMKQPLTEKGLKQRSDTFFPRHRGKKSNKGHVSFPCETCRLSQCMNVLQGA